jgi:hypothetical protein
MTHLAIDLANAATEAVAVISVLLDIHAMNRDKAVKGFNVWMKLWWLV